MVYQMWTAMGLAARQAQKVQEGAARAEVEGERELLEPVVLAKVLMLVIIGLVSNAPMPMSSLLPDVKCATSSAGENSNPNQQDGWRTDPFN